MWRIALSWLLLFFHPFWAQATVIDSLKAELSIVQSPKEKAEILFDLGKSYWQERNYKEAESMLQQAVEAFKVAESPMGVNDAYFILGRCYFEQAKYALAISIFTRAKDYALAHQQDKNAANQYNAIGITNKSIGKYPEAVLAFQGALKIYNRLHFEEGMAAAYHNLGLVYKEMSDLDTALVHFQYALDLRKEKGSNREVGRYLQSIANIYREQQAHEKAIAYAEKAIDRFEQAKDTLGLINAYGVVGLVQMDVKKFAQAQKTLESVLAMSIPFKYNLANTYFSLGKVNQGLNKHHKALAFFQKALNSSKFSESGNIQSDIHLAQSESYEALGQDHQALTAYKAYITQRDSLEGQNIKQQIKELDAKYQSELKDNKISLLAKDNQLIKRSRAIMLAVLLIGLLLGLVGWLSVRTKRLQTVQRNLELEQRLLRAQIKPHFLFNALTAIQSFTLKNGIEEGAVYFASFSKLMRSILESSNNELVTIKDELESIEHYLKLEKLRHGNLFDYKIDCDPHLNQEELLIPPMLIQPFLENSIKHGFTRLTDSGEIKITIKKEGNEIQFCIEDNGVGISQSPVSNDANHKSRSMKITQDRLKMHNKKLKKSMKFTVEDLSLSGSGTQGTLVRFRLPLIGLEES
ncbi:MAG TPA: tetratricopeptide repeat protein [Saprospiraceae bacterium]|nr:tetratricopeptide repeat protein [Saprospiraceae bacterium]